jgi:hypothetical protein
MDLITSEYFWVATSIEAYPPQPFRANDCGADFEFGAL